MAADRTPGRRFLAVLLVGIGAAALGAVAGNQPWATGASDLLAETEAGRVPAATALSLVVLACWGVVLVTRGWVRRAVAVLGALAALGVVATVVVGWSSAPDGVRDAFERLGVTDPEVSRTAWWWVAAVAALVSLAAALLAVRLVPTWPEMGRKYDADASAPTPADLPPAEEQSPLDLWQAIDQGRDPTA
jgi:uncharacterized membrane protein (TIGR02234 family)